MNGVNDRYAVGAARADHPGRGWLRPGHAVPFRYPRQARPGAAEAARREEPVGLDGSPQQPNYRRVVLTPHLSAKSPKMTPHVPRPSLLTAKIRFLQATLQQLAGRHVSTTLEQEAIATARFPVVIATRGL